MRVVKPKSPGMVLLLTVITCGFYEYPTVANEFE